MSEPKQVDQFDLDSPQAIAEMNRRHLRVALEMQQLGAQGLAELRRRGELTVEECKQALAEGLQLERAAAPGGSSRKRRH